MTRIINGVAYATDYEEIVGVEAGSGQHPVVRKVVTPGDVNFSDVEQPKPATKTTATPEPEQPRERPSDAPARHAHPPAEGR